jgi:iron complex transport system substrate-binding protein
MNLCTDQLAMLVAEEDQLISVSALAADPLNSAMADQAARYPLNHGRAEEIHLLDPDLVVTGRFHAGPTVDLLRRLGIPVVVFDPANSLEAIRGNIARMGEVLGQPGRAAEIVRAFDRRLAMLEEPVMRPPRAALYFPNGYTRGEQTLLGDIVRTAGFANIASDAGVRTGAHMPLERLVLAEPDVIITGSRHDGKSRSETILEHPALAAAAGWERGHELTTSDWVCGTPQALAAVERIGALRGTLMGGR